MTLLEGIILSVVAFILGFGLAWLILPRVREEEAKEHALEEKLEKYQKNVEEHLAKTADLLDDLTAQYKNVHDHLNETAQSLLSEEQRQRLVSKRQAKGYKILVLENQTDDAQGNNQDADKEPG
jgi:uncharacterized membrane-anchored protein YhcB (DUF1043 family)